MTQPPFTAASNGFIRLIVYCSVMPRTAFRGCLVLADRVLEHGVVVCNRGRIESVRRGSRVPRDAEVIDAPGFFIAPGYVDIHVHGGEGADYMDGTVDAVETVNRAHLRRGTTTIFPTTTTGSPSQVRRMIDACRDVQRNWTPAAGARLAGVHL